MGLIDFYKGVVASSYVEEAKESHKKGPKSANGNESIVPGHRPHHHAQQQYSRLCVHHDYTRLVLILKKCNTPTSM